MSWNVSQTPFDLDPSEHALLQKCIAAAQLAATSSEVGMMNWRGRWRLLRLGGWRGRAGRVRPGARLRHYPGLFTVMELDDWPGGPRTDC